jgi:thiosulfate/3-mercaptopyruvate sulfurtransferase
LDEDLSGPITPVSGRHPLPAPAQLARTLGDWGIGETSQVVAYDDAGGIIAARLWWLLRWLGHANCALLDGGLPRWLQRGLPLTEDMPTPQPATLPDRHDDSLWVDSVTVHAKLGEAGSLLLDARAAARFHGEMEPIDPVAGHIPGAENLPLEGNLHVDGHFLAPAELRRRYTDVLGERAPDRVIHMCGSGVTACHNLLAMEVAGLKGSKLYTGSWSEWIRDPARPISSA